MTLLSLRETKRDYGRFPSSFRGEANINSGIGQTMWQVIGGRVIAGLGAAGMTVIVSILITGTYLPVLIPSYALA